MCRTLTSYYSCLQPILNETSTCDIFRSSQGKECTGVEEHTYMTDFLCPRCKDSDSFTPIDPAPRASIAHGSPLLSSNGKEEANGEQVTVMPSSSDRKAKKPTARVPRNSGVRKSKQVSSSRRSVPRKILPKAEGRVISENGASVSWGNSRNGIPWWANRPPFTQIAPSPEKYISTDDAEQMSVTSQDSSRCLAPVADMGQSVRAPYAIMVAPSSGSGNGA